MSANESLGSATAAVWQACKLVWAVVVFVAGLVVLGLAALLAYGLVLGVVT